MIRDETIITHLRETKELPSVARIVTDYKCGWQQATRCRDAVREQETVAVKPKQQPLPFIPKL